MVSIMVFHGGLSALTEGGDGAPVAAAAQGAHDEGTGGEHPDGGSTVGVFN